jgi:hypothetical protein
MFLDLADIPRTVHGMKADSPVCPVRDTTLVAVASNPVWLQWVLIMMDTRQERLSGSPRPDLLKRRDAVYRMMSGLVKSDANGGLDRAFYHAIAFAGMIEHRLGNFVAAMAHLKACVAILRRWLGEGSEVPPLLFPLSMVSFSGFIGLAVPGLFDSADDLDFSALTYAVRIEAFRQWGEQGLGAVMAAHYQPLLGPLASFRHFWSSSGPLLPERLAHAIPWMLLSVFWRYRDDEDQAKSFAKALAFYLSKTEINNVDMAQPMGYGMLYMIVAALNAQQADNGWLEWTIFWDTSRFVETMSLCSVERRAEVRRCLYEILLVDAATTKQRSGRGLDVWFDEFSPLVYS